MRSHEVREHPQVHTLECPSFRRMHGGDWQQNHHVVLDEGSPRG